MKDKVKGSFLLIAFLLVLILSIGSACAQEMDNADVIAFADEPISIDSQDDASSAVQAIDDDVLAEAGDAVEPMPQVDTGVVSGDADFTAVNPGKANGTLDYTIPDGVTNINSAIVVVSIYGSKGDGTDGLYSNVTLNTTNGLEQLGYETLALEKTTSNDRTVYSVNDHAIKQYLDYQLLYDITSKVSNLKSGDTITIDVKNTEISGKVFDGRIKLIGLLFTYDDGDMDKITYWFNAGQVWAPKTESNSFAFSTSAYAGKTDDVYLRTIALTSKLATTYKINDVEVSPSSNMTGTFTYQDIVWSNISSQFNSGSDTTFFYQKDDGAYKTAVGLLITRENAANTIYVDYANGADTNDGLSEATAVKTLNQAISMANVGATIYVADGVNYLDGVDANGIAIDKRLSIIGLGSNVIIDGNNLGRIFNITSEVNLTNIIFRNADASKVEDKNFKRGGAIFADGATLIIDNCQFINNTAGNNNSYAGGINLKSSSATIKNSLFDGNTAWYAGSAINAENTNLLLSINDCVFVNNQILNNGWSAGGAICSYNTVIINRSVFYNNSLTDHTRNGESINHYDGDLLIVNSVLLGNNCLYVKTPDTCTLENNWWGNVAANKDTNPKDLNFTNGNINSYLVLESSVAGNVFKNEVATITTLINKNQNGDLVGDLPELPISYVAQIGVVNPASTTIDDQLAVTYKSASVGSEKLIINVLGIEDSLEFAVKERPVPKLSKNKDITMLYTSGKKYSVLVTLDGKPVVGEYVSIRFNGKTVKVKTDAKGYATYKLNAKPKKYTITATYKGIKVSNKVTIKSILSAKNLKVKKSAKKLKVKVALKKVNGKYLKSKKITLKFKGKKYKAKTNKKGVATFTIKKAVLKKLKAGKTYKYTATFGKDTIKKSIKVKK